MPSVAGTWSPLTVVLTVVMVMFSLVLAVALFVLAFMGRFWPARLDTEEAETEPEPDARPKAENPLFYTDLVRAVVEEADTAQAEAPPAGDETEPAEDGGPPAKAARPPRRQTGWRQLLAGIGLAIPALMVQSWVDNFYGRMVVFSLGTFLNLLLFAAQVFFTVWLVKRQRKLAAAGL